VTYREVSEVLTLGTRLSYDFSEALKMGLDLNYFTEERWEPISAISTPTIQNCIQKKEQHRH